MNYRLIFTVAFISILTACGARITAKPDNTFRHTGVLQVDGQQRSYTLNLPPTYYTGGNFALVIALHGGGGNAAQFEATSFLTNKANAAQFAVVYPQGSSPSLLNLQTWNGGGCCGHAVKANIDDVNFIRQLIIHLTGKYKLDPKQVYATGHSNGGIMSYRLACELSDKIAAIAPNAAAMMLENCTPSRAVPLLHMHSALDENVPIVGGVGKGLAGVPFPPLTTSMEKWVQLNGCQQPAKIERANQVAHSTWQPCRDRSAVELYVTQDGGHAWPGAQPGRSGGDTPSTAINANDLLWSFFQRHRLP